MQWLVFALLVVGSSVASFVTRERRFRRRWQNVELAVYYDPAHRYNIERMHAAMKASLAKPGSSADWRA